MPETTFAWPSQPASAPVAGWFTDPASDARLRWWDGAAWTEHVMDSPRAASAAPLPIEQWTPPAQVEQEPLVRERRRDRRAKGDSPAPVAAPAVTAPVPSFNGGDAHYVPISQQYSPMRMLEPMRTPGSPNTPAIWFLALLPLVAVAAQAGLYFGGLITDWIAPAGLAGGLLVLMILLVVIDRSELRNHHLVPASGWWILLLPPLAYFMARRGALAKQQVKSQSPGNVFVLALLTTAAIWLFVLMPIETGTWVADLVQTIQKLLGV